MQQPENCDFAKDVKNHINEAIIPKYTKKMPFRLVDTYTGLIVERSEIVSLLQMRRDYIEKLDEAVQEAELCATLIDPERPSDQRPKLGEFDFFVAEYLAFVMFSHRWRGSEPSLSDVRNAKCGVYSMRDEDVVEKSVNAFHFPKEVGNSPSGVIKLQEFCCLAAKCGYRWAWSDTCCIDGENYAERSESINSMFLWYRSSDLTIVYLDDVDEVTDGRLPAVENEDGDLWFENAEIRTPLPPSDPSIAPSPIDTYVKTLETAPYLSLFDRLRDGTYPELQSVQPDAQVDTPQLQSHIVNYFPSIAESKVKGQYRKPPIWVTRGWTLQEMIASKRLRFYTKQWTLLEEAEDRDTEEAEEQIFISSFRYRARLVDHRANNIWAEALEKTTDVPIHDLTNFKVGTRDVRTRLLWAARRETTKVEDKAYCLLGIFDVSLPVVYGEGPRAFIRLQEELIKRTGDVSLFDWCGRSSSVNSFLASSTECFVTPNLPKPFIPDSSESRFRMIWNLFKAIFGTVTSGIKAAISKASTCIRKIMQSPPPGHTLVNGELNVSLFEHQVVSCEPLERKKENDTYYHYKLVANGLKPTTVTLGSPAPSLINHPTKHYLCRTWNRHTQNVFQILLDLISYLFQSFRKGDNDSEDSEEEWCFPEDGVRDEDDTPGSKLRDQMQSKRKEVMEFFLGQFPVYLVRVEEERRIRVTTLERVVSDYAKFDFEMPVVTRAIL